MELRPAKDFAGLSFHTALRTVQNELLALHRLVAALLVGRREGVTSVTPQGIFTRAELG